MSGTAGSEPESNSEPLPEPESASESIPEIEPTPHAESESTSFLSEVESNKLLTHPQIHTKRKLLVEQQFLPVMPRPEVLPKFLVKQ
jgi:hypothetical protein